MYQLLVKPVLFIFLLALALLGAGDAVHAADIPSGDPPAGTREVAVESMGVVGFKKDFFGSLTITPYAADPASIAEGPGHSRVTLTQGPGVFDTRWTADNVEFVAFRIHKNPPTGSKASYFPNVMGSRYAKVVRVIDGHNLIVDFEYNGGNTSKPIISENASGYFFINCAPALAAMVASQDQPTVYRFKAGQTYVTKGMPNITFAASPNAGNMWWRSDDDSSEHGARANIKISAEDAYRFTTRGPTDIPDGPFFRLTTHDRSLYLYNINILGPTYSIPAVQSQWGGNFFHYTQGQCARTLEIRNCNTLAEKQAAGELIDLLPPGASWIAPDVWYTAGGGKRGDRGDGVIDIVGHQRWHLLGSTWIAKGIGSVKNNDGAGNWLVIDGQALDDQGIPVNMVYEAEFIKRNQFDNVSLSFHDGDETIDARRIVRVEDDHFSWPMLANQYWNSGLSASGLDFSRIIIEGFTLHLGNNGNFRRETGEVRGDHCILDAARARLFDRIPQMGDTLRVEHVQDDRYRIWGWGVQVKDVLTIQGKDYTIAARTRKAERGDVMGVKTGPPVNVWEITFEDNQGLPKDQGIVDAIVKTSATAFLLDGKPRQARLVYQRDLFGHWQYNRAEMNYQFRNIRFTGYYRQTSGPHNNKGDYQGLWEFPTIQQWVNCVAMQTDGSEPGKPSMSQGSQAYGAHVLRLRNEHPDSKTRDHHILVDGGRLFVQRLSLRASPVWIKNRPTLIYGSASFGEPRIVNPVLLDNKGLHLGGTGGMAIALTDGHTVDLSNSTFGYPDAHLWAPLRIHGRGTVILNNVTFHKYNDTYYNTLHTQLAGGLPDAGLHLTLIGDNSQGGLRFLGEPGDVSVKLTNWTIRRAPYTRTGVGFSPQWLAMPDLNQKVSINGKSGNAINNPETQAAR